MTMKTKSVNQLGKEWMQDPTLWAGYDDLAEKFALAEALIAARAKSDLTQEEIAERMVYRSTVMRHSYGPVQVSSASFPFPCVPDRPRSPDARCSF